MEQTQDNYRVTTEKSDFTVLRGKGGTPDLYVTITHTVELAERETGVLPTRFQMLEFALVGDDGTEREKITHCFTVQELRETAQMFLAFAKHCD